VLLGSSVDVDTMDVSKRAGLEFWAEMLAMRAIQLNCVSFRA
jgi:hypothetical protein